MFIDEAKITLRAGDGGKGCIAFRREKFVPRGGPSGGNGGHGGNIYLQSTAHENTLLKFRYNPIFRAERGRHGEGSDRNGRSADDLALRYRSEHWCMKQPPEPSCMISTVPRIAGWPLPVAGAGTETRTMRRLPTALQRKHRTDNRVQKRNSDSSSSYWPTWAWSDFPTRVSRL